MDVIMGTEIPSDEYSPATGGRIKRRTYKRPKYNKNKTQRRIKTKTRKLRKNKKVQVEIQSFNINII
jgi:hypothetical protein